MFSAVLISGDILPTFLELIEGDSSVIVAVFAIKVSERVFDGVLLPPPTEPVSPEEGSLECGAVILFVHTVSSGTNSGFGFVVASDGTNGIRESALLDCLGGSGKESSGSKDVAHFQFY